MLAKSNRLIRKKDFEQVFRARTGRGTDILAIKIRPNGQEATRFGLVVSAKVDKRAVVRNRVRRRLSESIRRVLKKVLQGFDIALIAKKNIADRSFGEIEKELRDVLENNHMLAR